MNYKQIGKNATTDKSNESKSDENDIEEDPEIEKECHEIMKETVTLPHDQILSRLVSLQHEYLQLLNDLHEERKKRLESQQKAFEYNKETIYYIDCYQYEYQMRFSRPSKQNLLNFSLSLSLRVCLLRSVVEENERLKALIRSLDMKKFEQINSFENFYQKSNHLSKEVLVPISTFLLFHTTIQ